MNPLKIFFVVLLALCALNTGALLQSLALQLQNGPEMPASGGEAPANAGGRPRLLTRTLGRVASPFRRLARALGAWLRRRPPGQAAAELQSLEQHAAGYMGCFARRPPANNAALVLQKICSRLDMEQLRSLCWKIAIHAAGNLQDALLCMERNEANTAAFAECFRASRLFLVHPLLQDPLTVRDVDTGEAVSSWLTSLRFVEPEARGPPKDLREALLRLHASRRSTVDTVHLAATAGLDDSSFKPCQERGFRRRVRRAWRRIRGRSDRCQRERREDAAAFLDEGKLVLERLLPHADALLVRIVHTMLMDGAKCSRAYPRSVQVLISGKSRTVRQSKMIDAAFLLAVENLFDASDCGSEDADTSDLTCRLLFAYDAFIQKGQAAEAQREAEGVVPETPRLQEIQPVEGIPSPEAEILTESQEPMQPPLVTEEGTPETQMQMAPGLVDISFLGLEPDDFTAGGGTEANSGVTGALPSTENVELTTPEAEIPPVGAEEPPQQPPELEALRMPQGEKLEEVLSPEERAQRGNRILAYTQSAKASASSIAAIVLESKTITFRMLLWLIRDSAALRQLARTVMRYLPIERMELGVTELQNKTGRARVVVAVYVAAVAKMATGSKALGDLARTLAQVVIEEELRRERQQEEESRRTMSLLQTQISPHGLERMLSAMGVKKAEEIAPHLAAGISIALDVLLATMIVILGITAGPVALSVAIVFLVLMMVKTTVVVFHEVVEPPTAAESAKYGAKRAGRKIKEALQELIE